MEEWGFIDIISGIETAGAVIMMLYADGYSPDEILNLFQGLSFNDLAEITLPRSCFFKIDRFKHFLQKSLRAVNIEDFVYPGCRYGYSNLGSWKVCSMAIRRNCRAGNGFVYSRIFPPVLIDGTHYVDGGVLRNLPVYPIRPECDVVIGINVSPLVNKQYKQSILDIAVRSYSFMSKSNVIRVT